MHSIIGRHPAFDRFAPFRIAHSKGYDFEIRFSPSANLRFWRFAILSQDTVDYANGYVTDDVLRVSATITRPAGYFMFRCDLMRGHLDPKANFQCKFGADTPPPF